MEVPISIILQISRYNKVFKDDTFRWPQIRSLIELCLKLVHCFPTIMMSIIEWRWYKMYYHDTRWPIQISFRNIYRSPPPKDKFLSRHSVESLEGTSAALRRLWTVGLLWMEKVSDRTTQYVSTNLHAIKASWINGMTVFESKEYRLLKVMSFIIWRGYFL